MIVGKQQETLSTPVVSAEGATSQLTRLTINGSKVSLVLIVVFVAFIVCGALFITLSLKSAAALPPLHSAAADGDLGQLRILLAEGQDVNDRVKHSWGEGHDGMTPLMIAAAKGHKPIVLFLLEKGADSTLTDRYGRTAFDHAELAGASEVCEILIKSQGED